MKWFITPIDASAANYFGVRPTVDAKGKKYLTMYGAFPYTACDAGIKSYYVTKVDNGMAVIKEISGTVPASTPVIIECPSQTPANNRLNIGGSGSAITDNKLEGVYFNNSLESHLNRVAYDKNTMRILGTCSDGSLGFVTSETLDYIPKNTAYLKVAAGSPSELKCVTQAEYDAYIASIPTSITLNQTTLTLTEGDAATLTATIAPAGAAGNQLTWTSSNPAVATVANGVVTAVAPGTATITAKTTNGLTATCTVTVNKRVIAVESITLNPTSKECTEGDSFHITATVLPENATDKTVTWTTSNAAVATVSNGAVTAVAPGTATITATTANGKTATCTVTVNKRVIAVESITLNPTSKECTEGESFHITATVLPENATDKTVTWTTSNAAVATVSNGAVTAVAPGTAIITAITANGLTATCTVTVNANIVLVSSIVVAPATFEGEIGATCQLTATVAPADATDASVTWSSSDDAIATVDANGLVTIVNVGTAVVSATANDGSGVKGECTISGQSGIEAIFAGEGTVDVYDMFGRVILRQAEAEKISSLPAGMYIINGKKVMIR